MKCLLLACIISGLAAVCWGEQEYTVENEILEFFKGDLETLADFSNINIVGRERCINGTATFLEDMDDSEFKFSVELYSSPASDGNYQRMVMDVPQTIICEGLKKFYVQFVQPSMQLDVNTDFPYIPADEGLCPFPAGTYYVKNIEFNTDEWPSQVPRGALKAIVTFFKTGVNVGGITVILKIEDK